MELRPKKFRVQLLYKCSCGSKYWVDYLNLKSDPKYFGDRCSMCDEPLVLQCPTSITAHFNEETPKAPTVEKPIVKRDNAMVDEIWEVVEEFGAQKRRVLKVIQDNKSLNKEDLIKKILSEL